MGHLYDLLADIFNLALTNDFGCLGYWFNQKRKNLEFKQERD